MKMLDFPMKNGGSFQFVMWLFTRGLSSALFSAQFCQAMFPDATSALEFSGEIIDFCVVNSC